LSTWEELAEAMMFWYLMPDWLVFQVAFKEIDEHLEKGQGVVLDGAIRTISQAQEYQAYFKKKQVEQEVLVIEIHIDDDEAFSRLTRRKICKECNQIYPNPEVKKIPEKCTVCNGELVMRADDDESVARNRLVEQGSKIIKPLHDYYHQTGSLHVIDGRKNMEDVEKEIDHILEVDV
jgi:adenylate kinase